MNNFVDEKRCSTRAAPILGQRAPVQP